MKLKHLISFILLMTLCAYSQNSNYRIIGTVVDANTVSPIANASIIVSTGFGQNVTPVDTLVTDADGKVNDTVSFGSAAYGIAYEVSATGYTTVTSYAIAQNGSIDLGTIELEQAQIDTILVIGIVTNSETQEAIEGASVSLSSTIGTDSSKTTTTNSQGEFSIVFIYDAASTLGYSYNITANDYNQETGNIQLNGDTIDIGSISLTPIQIETVSINGVVIDETSGEVIENATVLISAGDSSITIFTDNSGIFNSNLEYDAATVTEITYSIDKFGYREATGNKAITGLSIDIDTISLRKANLDTLNVEAQIYFTGTETAVSGVELLMYVSNNFGIDGFDYDNSDIQTLTSNTEGIISGKIIIENGGGQGQFRMLCYAVTLDKSENTEGTSFIQGDTIDLGTLYIDEPNTPISLKTNLKYHKLTPDQVLVYSLNGRILFSGKKLDMEKMSNISKNQQIIIVNKLKGNIISIIKGQLLY